MENKIVEFENDSAGSGNENTEPINLGYCAFCGDGILAGTYDEQDEADEAATRLCECKEAKKARKAAERAAAEEVDPPRSHH